MEPLSRWGQDVFVLWDAEDVATDVYLKAGLLIARALVIHREKARNDQTVCIHEMDEAVNTLTHDVVALDEIVRCAGLVKRNSETITRHAETLKSKVEAQLDVLRTHVAALQKSPPTNGSLAAV
jgi:hypothetical protein